MYSKERAQSSLTLLNMENSRKSIFGRLVTPFMETFGLTRTAASTAVFLIVVVLFFAVFWFFHSAPPTRLTISAGPPGSMFETNAIRYRDILKSNGVTLKIVPSEGSLQNLERLGDPSARVDIGFVQSGVTNATNRVKLYSLGSVSYQPLLVFTRDTNSTGVLSELEGKRIAIGAEGSGTRALALSLLAMNGIKPGGSTKLLDLDAGDAAKALLEGRADAVFLMGDSASPQVMLQLLRTNVIQLMDFAQADAYTRRVSYLNKLELPKGSIDFGRNIPSHDVYLIGPTVDLIARADLHPALSDLLLEAAQQVNGTPSLMRRKGEFPAPIENGFLISPSATRFYKSGKGFLYTKLPFWLASLLNRVLVAIVPIIVVLIPGLRTIPAVYRWRIRMRIYRWYRALLVLDRDLLGELTPDKRKEMLAGLDEIAGAVNKMKVPASFADQFYVLRQHIDYVRILLMGGGDPRSGHPAGVGSAPDLSAPK
ncbi:MAG TPA: TAXI family TRAP transporter solute-binding subunit [Verrucomicrobiae bacterium]|nr:TAXI family TRAP transporter solute-binding subunit [Verrucomicrobiae bacterium]